MLYTPGVTVPAVSPLYEATPEPHSSPEEVVDSLPPAVSSLFSPTGETFILTTPTKNLMVRPWLFCLLPPYPLNLFLPWEHGVWHNTLAKLCFMADCGLGDRVG